LSVDVAMAEAPALTAPSPDKSFCKLAAPAPMGAAPTGRFPLAASVAGVPITRHPMLPYMEQFVPGDEWGEVVSDAEWKMMSAGAASTFEMGDGATRSRLGADAKRVGSKEGSLGPGVGLLSATDSLPLDEGEGEELVEEEPFFAPEPLMHEQEELQEEEEGEDDGFTFVERAATVDVRCSIRFVDMEGLSDERSIKTIVTRVAPRKIVLLRGGDDGKQRLFDFFSSNALPNQDVINVAHGEAVDVSSDSSMYSVKLADELVRGLTPFRLGDYEISRIHGMLAIPNLTAQSTATAEGQTPTVDAAWLQRKGLTGVLGPLPAGVAGGQVHFLSHGDLKLAEFKQLLSRSGFQAEFMDGALMVNSSVRVRRDAQQKLIVEGSYCTTYMNVRKLLYEQFQIV